MNAFTQKLLTALILAISLFIVNCQGSSSSNTPAASTPTTAYGTYCGTNKVYSQYGCQYTCSGSNMMVWYQNSCQSVGVNNSTVGGSGSNSAICQTGCQSNWTQVILPGYSSPVCLPQSGSTFNCGACYGSQDGVNCYIGVYASQYPNY